MLETVLRGVSSAAVRSRDAVHARAAHILRPSGALAWLDEALRAHPGSAIVFTPQTGGSTTEDPIQVQLSGYGMAELRRMSAEVRQALAQIPGTSDVRDNLGPSRLDVKLLPNREALNKR